ncbi:substrate-binding domain-containing protein [Dongshaea marina]|uniref:substrate-binding domain-containing protein n=1 Tax=Dongshaea marina TaxID=2047966 RepID=UPI000D3ED1FE|nr:substrate-binding domain-containing protein [Dongshaea marina]
MVRVDHQPKRTRLGIAIRALLICSLALLLSACEKQSRHKPQLCLILSNVSNPFFASIRDAARKESARHGYPIDTYDSENSLQKENTLIQQCISNKAGVILLNPTDSFHSDNAVKLASEAKIPVITLDRAIRSNLAVSHVSSDNIIGGQMAANLLERFLKGEGDIGMLVGIPDTDTAQQRGKGFIEQIKKGPLTLVGSEVGNFDRHQGKLAMQRLIKKHPQIKAVFAQNDEMALGALQALLDHPSPPIVIGFDGSKRALSAIERGLLTATIAQQPDEMGSTAVKLAAQLLEGDRIPPSVSSPLAQVIRTNKPN